jgi:hypothetical protein
LNIATGERMVIPTFCPGVRPKVRDMIWSFAMSESDQKPKEEATEELLADMPLPSDAKTFFLGGIFFLSLLAAGYVASEIVLPLIFAIMLNLLMQPALRALEGFRVPRALTALLLILFVFATIVGLGAAVAGPAEAWMSKLPEGIPRILERLRFLDAPINTLRTFLAGANSFGAAGSQRSSPGPFDGGAIERLYRDAKLRQRAVHHRHVSLLPPRFG